MLSAMYVSSTSRTTKLYGHLASLKSDSLLQMGIMILLGVLADTTWKGSLEDCNARRRANVHFALSAVYDLYEGATSHKGSWFRCTYFPKSHLDQLLTNRRIGPLKGDVDDIVPERCRALSVIHGINKSTYRR